MNYFKKALDPMYQSMYRFFLNITQQSKRLYPWFLSLSKQKKIWVVILTIIVIATIVKILFGKEIIPEALESVTKKVTVAPVSSLSNNEQNFPLVGTVTSVQEATIRSESSGRLTYVSKKLGDVVYAGGVIAEFENKGERALLLQAEGQYEQAKAARSIAGLNSGQAGSSLTDTKNQAFNTIINVYTTLEDAVRGKTDTAFADPKFEQVKLLISVPDANLASSLQTKRKTIEKMLVARELQNRSATQNDDLLIGFTDALYDTQLVKTYLDDLYTAYSKALPDSTFSQSTLDAEKGNVQLARQAISATISGIVTAKSALSASITANQVAGSNNQIQSSGSIAAADAQVKQALGAYNAASSRLEKTIIRSPITGTLNSLTISTGDYIGAFTQVAIVSNNSALEVISLVTEDDAKRITVGSSVFINETISAVVTRIAPAIDPTTKKIEVRIGIKKTQSGLINGQSVGISIIKEKKVETKNTPLLITIPLSSLKLTPYGANVFSLSSTSSLISIPVQIGAILGEQIQILSGLRGDEVIVTDARGLKEGQLVETEGE